MKYFSVYSILPWSANKFHLIWSWVCQLQRTRPREHGIWMVIHGILLVSNLPIQKSYEKPAAVCSWKWSKKRELNESLFFFLADKKMNIHDYFYHNVLGKRETPFDEASGSYHRIKRDVKTIKDLGVRSTCDDIMMKFELTYLWVSYGRYHSVQPVYLLLI